MLRRTHRRLTVFVKGPGKTLHQHLTDPAHLFGRGRDSKEVADAVPDGADPSADLIPEPRSEGLDALPQPAHKVRTDLYDLGNGLRKGVHDALDDLRDRLDDLQNDGGEIFNEGDKLPRTAELKCSVSSGLRRGSSNSEKPATLFHSKINS
mgnify:CR=1 FL=1